MTASPDVSSRPVLPDDVVQELIGHLAAGPDAAAYVTTAPFTGAPLATVPQSSTADVDRAFRQAAGAQQEWALTPVRDRVRLVRTFRDLALRERDRGLDIVQAETGKARKDALEELLDVALVSGHYARVAPSLLATRRRTPALPVAFDAREVRHPKGVVGVIAPWNYPLTLAAGDSIPALLAGNAVVLKPDRQTTLTSLWIVSLMRKVGIPRDLIQVVSGDGPVVGPLVVDRADYVMFTGSTRVGRQIAARCGERLIGCSLELGGKNAMLVLDDADPRRAAEIAVRACFANSGQLCVSMERLYVDQAVYDDFLAEFLRRIGLLRLHAGVGWGADMGSLISASQLDRVHAAVQQAVSAGATLLAGGRARPDVGPYFYEPTVLGDVDESMDVCRQETFGPVVSIYPVSGADEAVARANDSVYGLNASVITRDVGRGRDVAARLRSGTVNVNEAYGAAWGATAAPMGGMGDSGIGRRHGDEGLLKYTEVQTIASARIPGLGLGKPDGWSDKRWGDVLIRAVSALRWVGR